MNAATLTSERLFLRPWRDEDLDPLFAINGDPESMRYFAATMNRAESDAWAARLRAHFAEHGWGFWVVVEAASDDFVGVVGLMTIPPRGEDPTPYFQQLATLARQHQLPELSMGMSEDYPQALAAGASLIRVGSYLFAED
jgi:RimJ/RimL family protein N-acetyltransferase